MDKARDVAGFVSVGPRQSDVLSARGKVGDIMIDAVEAMLGLHTLEKK
jgi:hypothetical protein